MVPPPRRTPVDAMNGSGKRDSTNMGSQRKDSPDSRSGGPSRPQNGARSGFRTDTAISNSRAGAERILKRWVPDSSTELDGALESTPSTGRWDQFAENERLFGLTTDYNENFYTTAIDRSHPQYSERLAAAERAAREIEKSAPTTAHVAEERVMDFTGADDAGADEEDKYSGVRRQQDFPPLAGPNTRDNKYTPPARRAPAGHSTVVGAPVDPAIISSQIKGGPRKQPQAPQPATPQPLQQQQQQQQQPPQQQPPAPKADEPRLSRTNTASSRPSPTVATPQAKTPEPKTTEKTATDIKAPSSAAAGSAAEPAKSTAHARSSSKPATPAVSGTSSLRASANQGRASLSPGAKATGAAAATSASAANSPAPPSATENVERALLKDFKYFASQERHNAEKARSTKMRQDVQVKLQELKKFANSFKLSTPVPNDLISIIAKDPEKQKQIREKAMQNAEELAQAKGDGTKTKSAGSSSSSTKAPATSTAPSNAAAPSAANTGTSTPAAASVPPSATTAAATGGPADSAKLAANNATARPQGPVHASHSASPSGMPNRHPGTRGPYQNYRQQSQPYRGDRSGPQHMAQGGHGTGHLAERIRNADQNQNRYNKAAPSHGSAHFVPSGDARVPPSGPANAVDAGFSRRMSGLPAGAQHMPQKLNPTTHEFRPNPFASSFNPTGPSAGSSPRSAINHVSTDQTAISAATSAATVPSPRAAGGVLIRRKTAKVSPEKCDILAHVKTIKPPQGRNWNDNDGLRPSYDTPVLWRGLKDDEKSDSTMYLTYAQLFERLAFAAASMVTPLQGHVLPHGMPPMAHQHQLPLHLQQHGGHMGPRPGQHMPMHGGAGGPHGHVPHVSFNGSDDHRMMPSSSAQSYASPRLAQVPMYPQQVGSTPQMAYNQPVMQPFMQTGPQMGQFRSYSNNPQQYMGLQPGPMMPMMGPPHLVAVQGGMPMYAGAPPFMGPPGGPGGGAPPAQHMGGGSSGYPSPSRPVAAPMMVQQGSQPGQPMYGMSPSMQFQQPAFGPQHPGQGGMRGGYNTGAQQYGTSPQNMHQYGPSHRNGSGSYFGKGYQGHGHGPHQGPPPHHGGHGGHGGHAGPPPAGHQGRPASGDNSEEAK